MLRSFIVQRAYVTDPPFAARLRTKLLILCNRQHVQQQQQQQQQQRHHDYVGQTQQNRKEEGRDPVWLLNA